MTTLNIHDHNGQIFTQTAVFGRLPPVATRIPVLQGSPGDDNLHFDVYALRRICYGPPNQSGNPSSPPPANRRCYTFYAPRSLDLSNHRHVANVIVGLLKQVDRGRAERMGRKGITGDMGR